MRIAIDLTSTPKSKTGIGRYMLGLLDGLQKIDSKNEYYLFLHDDDKDGFFLDKPNFHTVTVKSRILRYVIFRILWEQFVFPFRLRKNKIDVLQCPNFTAPYLSKILWPRLKVIGTFHDMSYFFLPEFHVGWKRELFKMYIRITARFADKIITISENSKKDIPKYCRPKNPDIAVTLLGADRRFFEAAPPSEQILKKYGMPEAYIMFVGTLEPRKNIPGLIEAFRLLPEALKVRFPLVICGKKGWYYEEIYESLVKWPELCSQVFFAGYIEDEDLPSLLKGAAAFAYVSFYEGFGIPVIEGLASGTITVTSFGSSLEEIGKDVALLTKPDEPQSICNALAWALLDHADTELEKKERIAVGIEHAAKFTWTRCAEATLAAYKQVYSNEKERKKG